MSILQFRGILISDVHLGTRDCRPDYLLDFLDYTESEYLYLVEDVFDLWSMRKSVHCTALNEDFEGNLQIVHWADHKRVEVATRGEEIDDSIMPLPAPSMGMSSIERSV